MEYFNIPENLIWGKDWASLWKIKKVNLLSVKKWEIS